MALITRVSRLFQADVNAVLDRIEEPAVLLRQAVREMEDELAQDEKQLKLLIHEIGQLEKRKQEVDQLLIHIESELDICFEHEKDDLARALIRRKLEAQQLQKTLSRKYESVQQNLSALKNRVAENHTRMESMRQKAELLSEESAPGQQQEYSTTPDVRVRDEDIEVTFLREKQTRAAS
ncbi:MAG: PspA/IM30 family protein [Gammaproteobacteria bacterium]|nr:PspA/IM30 family protein [Gammaproteobacteria bacterium]